MSSKLPFSLKGFNKVSADATHTTMRNGQGHEIKIAHKALSKEMREQLEKLPQVPKEAQGKQPKAKAAESVEPQALAKGGQVKDLEDLDQEPQSAAGQSMSGDAPITINIGAPSPSAGPTPVPSEAPMAQDSNEPSIGTKLKHALVPKGLHGVVDAIGSRMDQLNDPAFRAQMEEADRQRRIADGYEVPQQRTPAQDAQPHPTPMDMQAGAQAAPMPAQAPGAAPVDPNAGQSAIERTMLGGIGKQSAGIQQEAKALAQQGQAEAAIAQEQQALSQQRIDEFQEINTNLNNERQAFMQDIADQKIDANRFFQSKNTAGKISTVLGLIIGGLGGSDAPIKMLQQSIDKDIEAQKAELGKKENLLSANMKQFNNMRDAMEMTRVMQNDLVVAKLKEAAAKAATPLAQAAAMQKIGKLEADNAAAVEKISARHALQRATQQGSEQALMSAITRASSVDPESTKGLQERIIPGVGIARTAEDAKTIKEVEDRRQNIMSGIKAAQALIVKAGTYEALGPHNDDLNRLADQIATDMAKLQDPSSVARPGEVEMVKKTLVESGPWQQDKTAMSKLQAFQGEVNRRADSSMKARGITKFQAPEGEIKYKDGKPYRKVKGGWAPVK